MSKNKLPEFLADELVECSVISIDTKGVDRLEIRIVKGKLLDRNYKVALVAVDTNGKELVLDNGLCTKTRDEAQLCLAAMWRGVVYSLGHLNGCSKEE